MKRNRALTSIITIFGLLVFACLSWTTAEAANADSHLARSKTHQIHCTGPTSAVGYVAEIKPRLAALGSTLIAAVIYRITGGWQQSDSVLADLDLTQFKAVSPPLWLINRALLI